MRLSPGRRTAALFVDGGDIPVDRLPDSYSTIYQIATLPNEQRREALDQGVIRPDVTRHEIQALKWKISPPSSDQGDELEKLMARRQELENELHQVNARIAALTMR